MASDSNVLKSPQQRSGTAGEPIVQHTSGHGEISCKVAEHIGECGPHLTCSELNLHVEPLCFVVLSVRRPEHGHRHRRDNRQTASQGLRARLGQARIAVSFGEEAGACH